MIKGKDNLSWPEGGSKRSKKANEGHKNCLNYESKLIQNECKTDEIYFLSSPFSYLAKTFLWFLAEGRTDALITELMASSSRTSDPQKVLEEIEKERREMEEIFSIKAGKAEKLREQEIKSKLHRFN